ncbi:hypothetical protein ACQPT2_10610 [Erwinia amylovora]
MPAYNVRTKFPRSGVVPRIEDMLSRYLPDDDPHYTGRRGGQRLSMECWSALPVGRDHSARRTGTGGVLNRDVVRDQNSACAGKPDRQKA